MSSAAPMAMSNIAWRVEPDHGDVWPITEYATDRRSVHAGQIETETLQVVECFRFLYSYSTSTNANRCDLLKKFPVREPTPPPLAVGNLYHQTLLDSRGLVKASTTTVPSLPFYPIANGRWPVTNGHWLKEYFLDSTEHEIIGSSSVSP